MTYTVHKSASICYAIIHKQYLAYQGRLWRVGQRGHGLPNFSSDCCLLLELVFYASAYSARSWAWLDTKFHLIRDFTWKATPKNLSTIGLGLYQVVDL